LNQQIIFLKTAEHAIFLLEKNKNEKKPERINHARRQSKTNLIAVDLRKYN